MKKLMIVGALAAAILAPRGYAANVKEKALKDFIAAHVEKIKPLEKQANLASWDAAVTGDPKIYDRSSELTLQIRKIYSDANDFAYLKGLKESGQIKDKLLARQLTVLYKTPIWPIRSSRSCSGKSSRWAPRYEKNFSTFRGTIDGRKVTDNEIKQILKSESDSAKRQQAWLASKQVGQAVADDIVRLVKLRNQAARKLGFNNYHTMALATGEQDVKELDKIFDELYRLTNEPFRKVKADLDALLARQSGVSPDTLIPGTITTRSSRRRRWSTTWTSTSTTKARTSRSSRRSFTGVWGCPSRRSWPTATSMRKRARTRTPSAPTSIARATCESCATSRATRPGWRRFSTNWATESTTSTSISIRRICSARRRTPSRPRRSRCSSDD
jgi:hypothetical protein